VYSTGAVLDLARSHKSTVVESLIGDANADTAIRDAIDMRWESVPASTNRIVIRYAVHPCFVAVIGTMFRDGPRVGRFGPVLELPSTVLGELNAELLEIRGMYSVCWHGIYVYNYYLL
jgi:hypothetical protein